MPRKSRIIYEGAIYHIYQRGNNKEYIFEDSSIKTFLLRCLSEYNKKFDYEILAYAIMDNHYHLLIRTNTAPINQIMFYINNLLGKYIKTRLERSGHAFDGRYKSKLVDSNAYLIWLLRYIHRNPVKAGISSSPEGYYWSSHHLYANNIASDVNTDLILGMLGEDRIAAVKRYIDIVNFGGNESDKEKDYEITKNVFELKESSFKYCEINDGSSIKAKRKTFEEILEVLHINNATMMEISTGSRKQHLTSIKLTIIDMALKECYSLSEIGNFLNVAPSTISKIVTRQKHLM
jgi:putative transposase